MAGVVNASWESGGKSSGTALIPHWGASQALDCVLPICRKHRNACLAISFILFPTPSKEVGFPPWV